MILKERATEFMLFPFYINQERLLDIYAILNGGYAEYEEVSTASVDSKKKSGATKIEGSGGFKLFKIGASVDGSLEQSANDSTTLNSKKVQTPASMLSSVVDVLTERGYIRPIEKAEVGAFVLVPSKMKINSIKSLINEAKELTDLSGRMQALDKNSSNAAKDKKSLTAQIQQISEVVKELFGAEEIVCETDDYALVGSISDSGLYQSVRADIIGSDLQCLAQVKRVFPEGSSLMKNTVFTKLKDKESKQALIDALKVMTENSNFDYECEAITEIEGKPVYQLEIIALYQLASNITA